MIADYSHDNQNGDNDEDNHIIVIPTGLAHSQRIQKTGQATFKLLSFYNSMRNGSLGRVLRGKRIS